MAERGLPFLPTAAGARVRVRVTPKGGRDVVEGVEEGPDGPRLKLRVRVAPEDGKANDAVRALLAEAWDVPASRVVLVSGARGRNKIVELQGATQEVSARLTRWFEGRS